MSESLVASIFGWAGTVLACFFFISPANLFLKMVKTGSLKEIPSLMLIFNSFNCILWLVYGLSGGGTQVWVCNSIGLFFSMIYCIWYLLYFFEEVLKKILSILVYLVIFGGLIFFGIYCKIHEEDFGKPKVKVPVGWIALIINVIMYAAPGQNLVRIIK